MNHLDFANPSLQFLTPTSFGVTKSQGNSPREMQMGIRANFLGPFSFGAEPHQHLDGYMNFSA